MNDHLYRSRDDRMIAGVAGGLAELWDADPSLIRIAWALLIVLTGGIALLVYIIMAIVVPEEDAVPWMATTAVPPSPEAPAAGSTPAAASAPITVAAAPIASAPPLDRRAARRAARAARREARRARGGDRTPGLVIGGILIVLGSVFLLREWLPAFDVDWIWPLMLVGLGVVLLVFAFTRDDHAGGSVG